MSKFINTTYKETVNSIIDISKDMLKNPYYLFNDKRATPVTYYNINSEKSTLDEAARIPYADLGSDCPFRFNVVNDMMLFGLEKIQLSLANDEVGLESGEITGEAIILPNTIIPYAGDYFEINHIKDRTWLFKVNEVTKDTLDDGANIWKIAYNLERTSNENILDLIADKYTMVVNNLGTKYNPIIKSEKYDVAASLDQICTNLKKYYKELFYSSAIQSFCFIHYFEDHFYDPYMIEFLKVNNILDGMSNKDYVFIDHKLPLPNTFSLKYNKTFFRALETKNKELLKKVKTKATAEHIRNIMSIFNSRPEDYFEIKYEVATFDTATQPFCVRNIMTTIPDLLIDNCITGTLIEEDDENYIFNIIIKYFNNINFNESDLIALENIDFDSNIELFYLIPVLIYSIEGYIRNLMV